MARKNIISYEEKYKQLLGLEIAEKSLYESAQEARVNDLWDLEEKLTVIWRKLVKNISHQKHELQLLGRL